MAKNMELVDLLYGKIINYSINSNYASIFREIADHYYHENYHSDIIAYYLKHSTAKITFLEYLNNNIENDDNKIITGNYSHGQIARESNRIDITILNNKKDHAIIIENKSNNANDQGRQIYRYYKKLEEKLITVDAIFYLNKDSYKQPDLSDLTKKEINEISDKIVISQLVGKKSFCEEVIDMTISRTNDIRLNALSQEMRELFYYVVYGEKNMDNIEEMIKELSKDNNLNKIRQIIKAYNDIPLYLSDKYKNKYISKYKDYKIWNWKPQCLVIDNIIYDDHKLAIDIWFYDEEIDISLTIRKEDSDVIDDIKEQMGKRFPFKHKDDRYRICIEDILDEELLNKNIDKIIKAFI